MAARLALAALVFTAAVIFQPFGRPDTTQRVTAGGPRSVDTPVSVRDRSTSSTTANAHDVSATPRIRSADEDLRARALVPAALSRPAAAPFQIDLSELASEVWEAEQAALIAAGEWVEPIVEPESQWVDAGNGVRLPDLLLRIRFCESTNDYRAANGSSTARGAYQFLTMSWVWYGHAERFGVPEAHLATPAQQDQAALATFEQAGARPWAESRPCWDDPGIDPRYATAKPPVRAPVTTTTTAPPATSSTTDDPSTTTTVPDSTVGTAEDSTTTTTEPASSTSAP